MVVAAGRAAEPPPHVEHDGVARGGAGPEVELGRRRTGGQAARCQSRGRELQRRGGHACPSCPPGSTAPPGSSRYHEGNERAGRERPRRHHRDVPAHDPRARGGGGRPAARPDRRAAGAERPDREPDRRPDGARRPARRGGRPAPRAHRRRPRPRRRRHAQAPPRRAAAGQRHRDGWESARRGLPLGARDERRGGAKLVELLDKPTVSPYGNPIPGLDELERSPDSPRRRGRGRGDPPAAWRPGCSGSTSSPAAAAARSRCGASPSTCRWTPS